MGSSLIKIEQMENYNMINSKIVGAVLEIVCRNQGLPVLSQQFLENITTVNQICRFMKVPANLTKHNVILDVSHNLQGVNSLLERVRQEMPQIQRISVAFAVGKKKKIDDVMDLFESDERVHSVFVVGQKHFKLQDVDEAHESLQQQRSITKLKPLVGPVSNNIAATLDHVLTNEPTELLLVCGSFFIMTDVRNYFGYKVTADNYDL